MAFDPRPLYRRFVDEAWVQGDLDVVDEVISPDIVHHAAGPLPGPGPEGVKDFIRSIRSAFPDLQVKFENEVTQDRVGVTHITWSGTHAGPFMGLAATGRPVSVEVVDINRYDQDGKVVEHWAVTDLFSLFQQIGTMPEPALTQA